MKSEEATTALRKRLLVACGQFGKRHKGRPWRGQRLSPEQVHFMALGAIGMANAILDLRPENLEALIGALEGANHRGTENTERTKEGRL